MKLADQVLGGGHLRCQVRVQGDLCICEDLLGAVGIESQIAGRGGTARMARTWLLTAWRRALHHALGVG